MAGKKLTLNSLIPCCLKAKSTTSSGSKTQISNQASQRLSLSDVSYPGSPISAVDLSNSLIGSNLVIFTLSELRVVTKNFSKSEYIGEGGFGVVYKGAVNDKARADLEAQDVAVKMLDLDGTQGHREWLTEVIFLGQLNHPHLVNLIGYCCEDEHRLLVYEYMANGNLDDQLFRKYSAALPWLTRIKIAIGAAKGLAFLHDDEKPIIYRDFKASNVLLDSDYNAKLSDFGLATDGPRGDNTHVTTRVMGTQGYAAPEYISTGHLTTMSDVYGFGVVLLELLAGRRSVDKNRPTRQKDLVEWARPMLKDTKKLNKIMDSRLEGRYSHEGAKRAALLAHQCLSHNPKCRPTMRSVVKTLEVIMEFDDVPVGPFVYIAPNECTGVNTKKPENADACKVPKNGNEIQQKEGERREKSRRPRRKGYRHRHRIKSSRSRAIFSDTHLYQKIGTSLYSFNQQKQILPDEGNRLESKEEN